MIQALADLQFMRPQWLWALLALPPLALWWWRRRRRDEAWRRRVDPHLLPHLLEPGAGRGGVARGGLALAGAALAIVALAGPGWRHLPQPLWQDAAPLVIALDLSSATSAEDLQPSRLLQARAAIDRLLAGRAGGQVALVAFARDAHTVAPLTSDAANVRVFLDALAPDIMPTDGSRPERAIAWSAGLLRQAGFARGDILLLTHDAGPKARREAAAAAREGYAVSVLGLGTAEGAVHRDARGRLVRSRMDAGALRALAEAGSGRFAALDAQGVDALAGIGEGFVGGGREAGRASTRADQGYWLLLPLLLLAALGFRRGGALGVLALGLCLPLLSAPAQAQEGGLWQRQDQAEHRRALEAVEAYRGGDFEAAGQAWEALPGADSAYNRGNALARAGRLQEALEAYDEALELAPGMEDAIANRRAVEEAMRRQPPSGGGDDPEGGDDEGDGQGGDGQGEEPNEPQEPSGEGGEGGQQRDQEPADSAGDGAEDDSEDSPREDGDAGADGSAGEEPPPEAADAEAQRQADEALREQMQRALEQGDGGDDETGAPAEAPADAREREQREAAEAWLRRIPDDPGGLLRARFRLEHERRRREGTD